ncbi:MAG TPA: hypothetical protein VGI19_14450 [Candidatus Cybelea sp.]|jgi:hypothetical protein
MKTAAALTAAAVSLFLLTAAVPQRTADANVVTSSADPSVRIEVPRSAHYVGTQAWVLYGIADCRQFVYADLDAANNVTRLYWIQFEAYLPSLPKLHHQYTSKHHVTLGGLDFYVDTWIEAKDGPTAHAADVKPLEVFLRSNGYAVPPGINSGSDEQHVDALLGTKDLRLPQTTISVRLVHLADEQQRKELMVIYSEDLTGSGLRPDDTKPGTAGYGRWQTEEAGLISRAKQRISVSSIRGP